MNNKAQRETVFKRFFVKSSFIVITLSLFGCTAVVAEFNWELSQLVDNSISQAVNKTVYVLLFNPRTENEETYTIYFQGRNKVLAFESFEDAHRFSQELIRQDFPAPTVEAIDAKEIENFCRTNDYDYELIPQGEEILPPLDSCHPFGSAPCEDGVSFDSDRLGAESHRYRLLTPLSPA